MASRGQPRGILPTLPSRPRINMTSVTDTWTEYVDTRRRFFSLYFAQENMRSKHRFYSESFCCPPEPRSIVTPGYSLFHTEGRVSVDISRCRRHPSQRLVTKRAKMSPEFYCDDEELVWSHLSPHPLIVELFSTDKADCCHIFRMEYCLHMDLSVALNQNRAPYTEQRCRAVMKQVAQAVEYMHSKNVVHRDLKPANIFLVDHDVVKIGDFGHSTFCGPDETVVGFVGSLPFMAPEIHDFAGYGQKVDIFAIGVTLYYLSHYANPWDPEATQDPNLVLANLLKLKYTLNKDVSIWIKALIQKMMARDSKDRPTAVELLRDSWFHTPAQFLVPFNKSGRRKSEPTSPTELHFTIFKPLLPSNCRCSKVLQKEWGHDTV